jgi:hypothetical protein
MNAVTPLEDILVFTHRTVGYKSYQVRIGEWVNHWPAVLPNGLASTGARVIHYVDRSESGIGEPVETVKVTDDSEAEDVIRRMLGIPAVPPTLDEVFAELDEWED